jgi:hypothetical protein
MTVRTGTAGTALVGGQAAAADFNGLPGGWIGYVPVTTAQGGFGAPLADITGLAVTVTAGTNRRLKITAYVNAILGAAAGLVAVTIMEGATQLNGAQLNGAASASMMLQPVAIVTPTAGAHTYKVQMNTTGASGVSSNAGATQPAFILVEDIGPA